MSLKELIFIFLLLPVMGYAQLATSESIFYFEEDGISYSNYNGLRSNNQTINIGYPRNEDPQTYFSYLYPKNYTISNGDNPHLKLLNFQGGNYASIINDKLNENNLTIDGDGLYTFKMRKLVHNGNYGFYWLTPYGNGYESFTYVWILPENFEFVDYSCNQEGTWVKRKNSITFYGQYINNILFTIKYKKKTRTPSQFSGRDVKINKRLTTNKELVQLLLSDNAREDGDIISISLNGEWIAKNLYVTESPVKIDLYLRKGNNYLIMYAENEGEIPPNTAKLSLLDQEIILSSSKESSQAIEINVE